MCEVEAFVSKPSVGSIEVKFVGLDSNRIQSERVLKEELNLATFSRLGCFLSRWLTNSVNFNDVNACNVLQHVNLCIVYNDGSNLLCCKTYSCVAHTFCVALIKILHQ